MECKKCGYDVPENEKYCNICGTRVKKEIKIKFSYIVVVILIIAILIATIIFLLLKRPNQISGIVSEQQSTNTTIEKETKKIVENKNVDDEDIKREQRKQMAEAYAQSVMGENYKCKYMGNSINGNNSYTYTINVYKKENTRVRVGWFSVEIVNDVVKPSASYYRSSVY